MNHRSHQIVVHVLQTKPKLYLRQPYGYCDRDVEYKDPFELGLVSYHQIQFELKRLT